MTATNQLMLADRRFLAHRTRRCREYLDLEKKVADINREFVQRFMPAQIPNITAQIPATRTSKREATLAALRAHRGNLLETSSSLYLTPSTVWRRMKNWKIEPEEYLPDAQR